MKPFKIFVILFVIWVTGPAQVLSADTAITNVSQQQLEDAESRANRWRTVFYAATALYIFVYIMGRRRLMRKIWARNRELKIALDKAQESDRLKTAFIRNMSHEIRTPLNAINGFTQLLCNPEFELTSEERQDMMERISHSAESITSTVAELLDMSEGESLHEKEPVAIVPLCRSLMDNLRKADQKGLDYHFDSELEENFVVMSSPRNIRSILQRVLDNAVKFTEHGSIIMECEKIGPQLVVSVTDTGIGIAPQDRDRVFEKFVQLDDYADGVGLGLPLSLRLARKLGGDLQLDNTYMGGARFLFTLPI